MRLLYIETRKSLRRGLENSVDREAYIDQIVAETIERLKGKGISAKRAREIWEDPDPDFFLQHSSVQIAAITEAIENHSKLDRKNNEALVLVRDVAGQVSEEGATEIFLYTQDKPNLFTLMMLAMDSLELSIFAAYLHTSRSNMCFNTYIVLDKAGKPLGTNSYRHREARDLLSRYIANPYSTDDLLKRRSQRIIPRRLKQFKIPSEAIMSVDKNQGYSVLRVITSDRPGLLAHIGLIFLELDIRVRSAKITTLGEKVEDVFYITDKDNLPITDEARISALTSAICSQLDEEAQNQ